MQRTFFVCWRNFLQCANAAFRRRRHIGGSTFTQRQLSELPLQGLEVVGKLGLYRSSLFQQQSPTIPPIRNSKLVKGLLIRLDNVLGKIQPPGRCYEMAFVFSCVNRIRLWPLRRDNYSGGLIGARGTRSSDWPVLVRSRIDQ